LHERFVEDFDTADLLNVLSCLCLCNVEYIVNGNNADQGSRRILTGKAVKSSRRKIDTAIS
jgi:hypothetical protein